MKRYINVLENTSVIIIILWFILILFFIEYIPERILFGTPLIISILSIPTVLKVIDRNQISEIRRRTLYIFNSIINCLYLVFIVMFQYINDRSFYLLMFYMLLIQGGISGILTKHMIISRTNTSNLDGKLIVYILNGIFIAIGIIAILAFIIDY